MESLRPNNDEFKNKVVIITGGATGIGLACAKLFARREASVAIFGNSEKDLNSAYKELKTYSSNVITIFADVSKEKSLNDAFLDFDRHFDTLSILVCNAAIQPYGTVEKTPVKVWDKVQDTNIRGAFLSAQESIPRMRNVGGGSIINITSAQGSATQERVAAYSTSKGGLLALTRAQ
jgi:NAD(P)-dependent dehydrogenase (short-subunit alcohol dehydrogenase family)